MSVRANQLANRIEEGANQLSAYVEGLTKAEWETICPLEKRPIGVLVHHVASAYLVEMNLMKALAANKAIEKVTWNMVDQINAEHAEANSRCSKTETLGLLKHNSSLAADAGRTLSDKQLDQASPISLHWDAPLTTQYFIEQHPVSHSYTHLASIREILNHAG